MGAYDDIINLPHPNSAKHPRMSMIDRAAQFSSFAALTGHGAAIEETARLTDRRIELTEEVRSACCWKRAGRAGSLSFFPMSGRTAGPTSPNLEPSKKLTRRKGGSS